MAQQVLKKGWQHNGCGPWKMVGRIPSRWRKVRDGKSKKGDRCLVATTLGVAIAAQRYNPKIGERTIPCGWVDVLAENIGVEAKSFLYLIRQA